jgi:uncharacterized protein (UPF0332 family)
MTGRDFLALADALAAAGAEAEWRTSISRSYYAAFHAAREFMARLRFRVPAADQAHAYLWMRRSNTGDSTADRIGRMLRDLRGRRNAADYDLNRSRTQANAIDAAVDARDVTRALDAVAGTPAETAIRDGMRAYEQSVLKVDTWGP